MTGTETREIRVKRLAMRSMRRGIKEMDLILHAFAQSRLAGLPPEALDAYEALLEENDHDLYEWVSGQRAAPPAHAALIEEITKGLRQFGPKA